MLFSHFKKEIEVLPHGIFKLIINGRVYFVPVIEGPAVRREHNFQKLVSIGEMLLFFGNDELCSRRAAPATPKIVIFDYKKIACGKPPAEGNGVFPHETLFGAKKSACGKPPAEGNGKKHQYLHKTVIRRTFRARS